GRLRRPARLGGLLGLLRRCGRGCVHVGLLKKRGKDSLEATDMDAQPGRSGKVLSSVLNSGEDRPECDRGKNAQDWSIRFRKVMPSSSSSSGSSSAYGPRGCGLK